MNLKVKVKNRIDDSSDWIMDEPKSLTILMLMAASVGSFIFTVLAILFFMNQMWLMFVIFGVFDYGAIKKLVDIVKAIRLLGWGKALGGFTAREFVWHGGKDEYSGYQSYEDGNKYHEEGTGKIGEEVRSVYREPKRPS